VRRRLRGLGIPYRLLLKRARMLGIYAETHGGIIPPDAYLVTGEPTEEASDKSRLIIIHRSDIIGRVLDDAGQ